MVWNVELFECKHHFLYVYCGLFASRNSFCLLESLKRLASFESSWSLDLDSSSARLGAICVDSGEGFETTNCFWCQDKTRPCQGWECRCYAARVYWTDALSSSLAQASNPPPIKVRQGHITLRIQMQLMPYHSVLLASWIGVFCWICAPSDLVTCTFYCRLNQFIFADCVNVYNYAFASVDVYEYVHVSLKIFWLICVRKRVSYLLIAKIHGFYRCWLQLLTC